MARAQKLCRLGSNILRRPPSAVLGDEVADIDSPTRSRPRSLSDDTPSMQRVRLECSSIDWMSKRPRFKSDPIDGIVAQKLWNTASSWVASASSGRASGASKLDGIDSPSSGDSSRLSNELGLCTMKRRERLSFHLSGPDEDVLPRPKGDKLLRSQSLPSLADKFLTDEKGFASRRRSSSGSSNGRGYLPPSPKTPVAAQHAAADAGRRQVTFCPSPLNSCHEVMAYSRVYGQHPNHFNFSRNGEMALTDAGVVAELDDQVEDASPSRASLLDTSSSF